MWEQPILSLDDKTDLKGIWASISLDQRQKFIVACAMLLVKVASTAKPKNLESEDE
jgi:hypothetical protein